MLLLAALLLVLGMLASLSIGSNPIPLGRVWQLLWTQDGSFEAVVVLEQRLPRTLIVVVVGSALGVAGALMQSLTRNPLADPGILGINAGASLAVVLAVVVTGVGGIGFYLWFAFGGAAVTAVAVYVLGMAGHASPSPVRLALAGVAISMTVASLVQTVILADANAFNEFRFWAAGSVEGRGYPVLLVVLLPAAGLLARPLGALVLGDELAAALGVRVERVRTLLVVVGVALVAVATATAGPIGFIALASPQIARRLTRTAGIGLGTAALTGAALVLASDLVAQRLLAPTQLAVGVVTGVLGGGYLIWLLGSQWRKGAR